MVIPAIWPPLEPAVVGLGQEELSVIKEKISSFVILALAKYVTMSFFSSVVFAEDIANRSATREAIVVAIALAVVQVFVRDKPMLMGRGTTEAVVPTAEVVVPVLPVGVGVTVVAAALALVVAGVV